MATYYVAVNGNDRNNGSLSRPFATLKKAISELKSGDLIYLRGGTYYQNESLWLGDKHSGTAGDRTAIRAYPGEKVIIDGWDQNTGNIIDVEGDHIDISGLEIKNSPRHGIGVWGGDHVRIKNNTVHNTQKGGIAIHGEIENGIEDRVYNVVAESNTVYRTNLSNSGRWATSGWASGINAARATNATIKNNRIFNNYGEGIALTLSTNSTVADNVTHDNYSVEIYLDNVRNSVVERNLSYNTGNSDFYRQDCGHGCKWTAAVGIQLGNEDYGTSAYSLNGITIRNNIVVATRTAFAYGSYETSAGLKNGLIANNTFYGSKSKILHIEKDNDNANITFANNIFDQGNNTPRFFLPDKSRLNFQNNLLNRQGLNTYNNKHFELSSNDIIGDSSLAQAGGTRAKDYQLRSDSDAINSGIPIDLVTHDFFKRSRPINGKVDIGAFETNATPLGDISDDSSDQVNPSNQDSLHGNGGNNVLIGKSGNDTLFGYRGNDKLIGYGGHDSLVGAHGSDALYGGGGNDTLMGANNNSSSQNSIDVLKGGSGRDLFILGSGTASFYNSGTRNVGASFKDYAIVSDFDKNFDSIKLNGAAHAYVLRNLSPIDSVPGKALFLDHNRNGFDKTDELIAVIQTSQHLSLPSNYFSFIQ